MNHNILKWVYASGKIQGFTGNTLAQQPELQIDLILLQLVVKSSHKKRPMFSASGLQIPANQGRQMIREPYSFEEGN